MNKEKDIIITLDDDKRYVLIATIDFENKKYVYLSNLEDFKDIIIGEIINDEITEVEDLELFGKLLIEFSKII